MIRARSLQGMAVLLVAVLSLSMASCSGSKLTMANYDKINTGMTEAEVEGILGKGEEKMSVGAGAVPGLGVNMPGIPNVAVPGIALDMKTKEWKEGSKTINIIFVGGKVSMKAQNNL